MLVWRAAVAAAVLLVVSACGAFKSETYRYRMTVEVETPRGVRTGSSVIKVTTRKGPAFPGPEAGSLSSDVKGEAVAVDLPGGHTLFALLRSPDSADGAARYAPSAYTARNPRLRSLDWQEQIREVKKMQGEAELPRSSYPMLVRFRNINDPTTVEEVEPGNLAAAFGEGVRLRRITVEMTDDHVTKGIAERFPWWGDYQDRHFDGTPASIEHMRNTDLAAHMSSGSFSTE